MVDRHLLGDCAAVGVSDDIRPLDADRIKHPCSDIRQHGHRVRNHRSFARANPGAVKAMTVLPRSAPAKNVQLSIGRDMPLSNNTGSPDPVIRATSFTDKLWSEYCDDSLITIGPGTPDSPARSATTPRRT